MKRSLLAHAAAGATALAPAVPCITGCVAPEVTLVDGVEPAAPDDDAPTDPPRALPREELNGVDWNGIDWNGIDWNGVDWNGIDWNGVDWNGVDWNGIDADLVPWAALQWTGAGWAGTPSSTLADVVAAGGGASIDWNAVDWSDLDRNAIDWQALAPPGAGAGFAWSQLEVLGVVGAVGGEVRVHPRSRPLFVFVHARAGAQLLTVAIPSPGALAMIDQAPDRDAALYLLAKTWQIAYGPGFWLYAGIGDLDGDGLDGPVAIEGRVGTAPALAGLGPYLEPQVEAWSSLVGNLLNSQPFQLSIRAYEVVALGADQPELDRYTITDLRGVIGRIMPAPDDPLQQPVLVLIRDRRHLLAIATDGPALIAQLDRRMACPLGGQPWARCYGDRVTVVDLEHAEAQGFGACTHVTGYGPYTGTVGGQCWVALPHVAYAQDAAAAPITATFVDLRRVCPECEHPPLPPEEP